MRMGRIYFFPGNDDGTVGTRQSFHLPYVQWPGVNDDVGYAANAILHDVTDDGLLDLMMILSHSAKGISTSSDAYVRIIPNTGSATSYDFDIANEIVVRDGSGSKIGSGSSEYQMINYGDLDNDGVKDLIHSIGGATVHWYKNNGTSTNPSFGDREVLSIGSGLGASSLPIGFADADGDGDDDVLLGTGYNRSLFVCYNGGAAVALKETISLTGMGNVSVTLNDNLLLFNGIENGKVSLINSRGQDVSLGTGVSFDISSIAAGYWIARIVDSDKVVTVPFIKR